MTEPPTDRPTDSRSMLDLSSGVVPVVTAAFAFMGKAMDARKARIEVEGQDRFRRELLDWEERKRADDREFERESYVQARQDRMDDERQRDRSRVELRYYPFKGGPGVLRDSVRLTYEDAATMPPVVLLVPTGQHVDDVWRSLPASVESSLMPFQNRNVLFARLADRWTAWPDSSLVENDLRDLPTIVTLVNIVGGVLDVRLGGCNLGGKPRVQALHQVASLALPSSGSWTESRLSALERASTNGFRRPEPLDTPEAQRSLQLEWATRIAVLSVIAAADAFHLQRRVGYDEQIDTAAAMLGPDFTAQMSLPVPRGALADPAYHLLHAARRQIAAGDMVGAAATVIQAIQTLGGGEHGSLSDAVAAARAAGRLQEWHGRLLTILSDSTQPDVVVPQAVLQALAKPPAATPEGPEPERRELNKIRPGDVNDPWDRW